MPPSSKIPPDSPPAAKAGAAGARQERLAKALRDNLKKRKAQQRARAEGPGDAGGDGGEKSSGKARQP